MWLEGLGGGTERFGIEGGKKWWLTLPKRAKRGAERKPHFYMMEGKFFSEKKLCNIEFNIRRVAAMRR